MRLAIVGCGRIADFHASAMRETGFNISAISGRPGVSESVKNFAKKFNVENIYSDSFALIKSSKWDALLLTSPTETIVDYLKVASVLNKPILAEKPISIDYKKLEPFLKFKNISVAFNRRFYNSVEFAKEFIRNNEKVLIKVTIPEKIVKGEDLVKKFKNRLNIMTYENSVHIFDIMNYLVGKIKWDSSRIIYNEEKCCHMFIAMGISENKTLVLLDNYYNASDNFSVELTSFNRKLLLKPIEMANYYEGMQVQEPSKESPIRTYNPILKKTIIEEYNNFKPGFYLQARDFMKFCKKHSSNGAKILDAYNALKTVEDIVLANKTN